MQKNDCQNYEDLQPTTSQPPVYIDLSETPDKNEEQHVYVNKMAIKPRGRTDYINNKSKNDKTYGGPSVEYDIAK